MGRLQETRSEPSSLGTLGGYRLTARLGRGAMGTVYRGAHLETGAEHALKVIDINDAEQMVRFQREGEAQARVDGHPHVVRVHSAGATKGRAYLVLDLAEGGSLSEQLQGGPLEPRRSAALVRDLARGLAHVHAQGVLHRDLKPSNVLFDATGAARLTDFGLARLTGTDRLTKTGELLGTPSHMAPEQVTGQRCGPATDIYGLGAVLYHCLTGRPPHDATTALGAMTLAMEREPIAPSRLRSDVPRGLEAICQRAMAREPQRRYGSADELADCLEGWLAGEQETASGGRVFWVLASAALLATAPLIVLPLLETPEDAAPVASKAKTRPPPTRRSGPPSGPPARVADERDASPAEARAPGASDSEGLRQALGKLNAVSDYNRARSFWRGNSRIGPDLEKAEELFRIAAAEGMPQARTCLARLIQEGGATDRYPGERFALVEVASREAEELGDPRIVLHVATAMVQVGPGTWGDETTVRWIERVARDPTWSDEPARLNGLLIQGHQRLKDPRARARLAAVLRARRPAAARRWDWARELLAEHPPGDAPSEEASGEDPEER